MRVMAMLEKSILLALGFLLTTVLGGVLGFFLKQRLWKHQTEHALYRSRYEEGTKYLDEISTQVGKRFFLLQRYWWAIEAGDPQKVREREIKYFACVIDWNSTFWKNRNKIRLLVDEDLANAFLDYRDDEAGRSPTSLHYKFVVAHQTVIDARLSQQYYPEAASRLTLLNWACSVFLERLTTEFINRAVKLQLLEVPSGPGPAEDEAHERELPI